MMRILLYSSVVLLFGILSSCTSKESPVLDMSDILPEAQGDYDRDSINSNTDNDSLKIYQVQFAPLMIKFDTIRRVKTRLIVDRFGHLNEDKFELIGEGQVLQCYKWTYLDSARTINALYNWIDCFGNDCMSTLVGEEKNLQKNAFHIYANDTSLIYFESDHALKTASFDNYLKSMGFEKDWNYTIEQSKNGRAKWYTYTDEVKKRIQSKKK